MKRVKSGIPGLDELIEGGFLPTSTVLISGTAGAGKTLFCSQFIYNGAKKYNEPGVYLTFEETPESIITNMKRFGCDFQKLIDEKKVSFLLYDIRMPDVFDEVYSAINKVKAKRVCIDSIATWGLYVGELGLIRRRILEFLSRIRATECTTLLTTEIPSGSSGISRFGVEEFLSDCVIILNYLRKRGAFERSVIVWKYRGSEHSYKVHPFKITNKGIAIFPKEEVID
ncbi:MAG: ATPase domain-containing protein [Candidatus Aenigmarchaeota archaeon]|nr:ATPase domain-containing protein [Candidatus Aenigmarchaeota archaeon]